jgi:hypothetical protein
MTRRRKVEPFVFTREWMEYVVHDELCWHMTPDQCFRYREHDARLKVWVTQYFDALAPDELPAFPDAASAFRWLDERLPQMCDAAGVNRHRVPLY